MTFAERWSRLSTVWQRCAPFFLVFFVGFCLMMVEIIASRLVAPYIGVSIFTWTSLIGVVLIGVSAGAYAGGIWASQERSKTWIGRCILFAGVSLLLIDPLLPILGQWFITSQFALWERALIYALTCFFIPSFFLSSLSPQIARVYLHHLTNAGRFAGGLGAWNALGSIVGTVLAGFVLIPIVGTKWIVLLLGTILIGVGYMLAHDRNMWRTKWTAVVVVLWVGSIFAPTLCQRETNYYCIHVAAETQDGSTRYILRLDHLVHSFVDPAHPTHVGYGYEQLYKQLIAVHAGHNPSFSSLFIGGGGYTLPRYLAASYPTSTVTVVEIDPGVTKANLELMALSSTTTIRTVNEDARAFLRQDSSRPFDLVFGDAFNDFSVPYHLTTQEFHQALKQRMAPDGIYALNIIDDAKYGSFLAAMIRTLRSVWTYVYVAPLANQIKPGRDTYVLMATDVPIDPRAWASIGSDPVTTLTPFYDEPAASSSTLHLLTDQEVDAYLSAHPAPVLRDDYVPLDRYLAPVFQDAY